MDDALRELSRVALGGRELADVLGDITAIAARVIPGAESVSTTLIRGEKAFTAAHAGAMSLEADELQYEEGSGPCIDAGRGGVVLRIDDVRTEERWPDYMARVRTTRVRSSLSVPLPYQGTSIGALNVYSTEVAAFASPDSLAAGLGAAEMIAVAVANADAHARLADDARNMRIAMESRAVIEQAKGVLMAQQGVDAEQAFEVLRQASQRYNRKLRDIAAGIVDGVVARS
ncbi:GAF and ANTAR domain-containing protein [Blastococcus sp. VKM Ac-2987]|uniref:GAF and ANTAR domain-containing protein n=1 Tax=Blastococcus sp. VKM Ac-2987 TaxID=3004141 RepID=UPI0022AB54AE|nr:GAF and ANTAR domain-containing protein [Blastococcus sp. VKM Ac-2987]MCZ2858746.1 GAF and ANTAR domain-containing protein [Blastococcus sp. VKM Ac-2987]